MFCRNIAGGRRTFFFRGKEYRYFFHPYNLSWMNERTVEIPIIRSEMCGYKEDGTLEIGNVLSHYGAVEHEVLDKYEQANGVVNEDALNYDPGRNYDLVICISTLEHIGQDENGEDGAKALDALDNIVSLLEPGGKLVASVPIGHNRSIDDLVLRNSERFDWISFMMRTSGNNQWEETSPGSALRAAGEGRFLGNNAVAIFSIVKDRGDEKDV